MQKTYKMWVQYLGQEDPLEKGMTAHSSILAWRIPMDRRTWQVHRGQLTSHFPGLLLSPWWLCPIIHLSSQRGLSSMSPALVTHPHAGLRSICWTWVLGSPSHPPQLIIVCPLLISGRKWLKQGVKRKTAEKQKKDKRHTPREVNSRREPGTPPFPGEYFHYSVKV